MAPKGLRALLNSVSRRMAEKLHGQTQVSELSQKLLGLVASLGETGMDVSMLPVETTGGFVLKAATLPLFRRSSQPPRNLRHGAGNDGRATWPRRQSELSSCISRWRLRLRVPRQPHPGSGEPSRVAMSRRFVQSNIVITQPQRRKDSRNALLKVTRSISNI